MESRNQNEQEKETIIELLNKLDKDVLIALCQVLLSEYLPWDAKKILIAITNDLKNEKHSINN